MNDDAVKQRQKVEAQVERWTAEAKKLADAGKEGAALELYRRAAEELPGAPWLQHRTAELARKLKKNDVAIAHFRRAAMAFQMADFSKRAVAPLRTAWVLAMDGLPATSRLLVDVATELVQLHRRLGFAADATVAFERTNAALRSRGFSEIGAHVLEALPQPTVTRASPSPSQLVPPSSSPPPSSGPRSEIAPRSANPPENASSNTRGRAVARLLGRR
ncbi:MAG TPA: hypothetical protein VHB79_22655 [Polyangiaceae bacterium]|nr:hypothetical protein [Polyangiaceae bacterium]